MGGRDPSRIAPGEWGLLLVLAAVQFTHILDFVIVMPLGPQLTVSLEITAQQFGWMVSAYGFAASLSGLAAAWFIDRFDRKRALLGLYAGFTVGTLLCAAAPSYLLLLVARAVAGGFAGVVAAVVLAAVGDVFPDSRRGTAMGVVLSAFSVASIVGVPAGLYLANATGWRTPFAVLGILSAGVWLLAAAILPPLRSHLNQAHGKSVQVWKVLSDPAHLPAYSLMVLLVMGTWTIVPYLTIYLVDNVGRHTDELPYVYLCGGTATLLTMTVFGRLSDRFGKLLVFRIIALITLVPTVWLTNLPNTSLAVTLFLTTFFMVGSSGRWVPAMAMLTGSALPAYRGSFMSINASVQQMAAGLAALISGAILSQEESSQPLTGFREAGLLGVAAMLASIYIAGRLPPAAAPPASEAVELIPAESPLSA